MNKDKDNTDLLWVCVDCYETHHGVREDHNEPPDREPLNLIPADADVTGGMFWEQHEPDCEHAKSRGDDGGECECERQTFSWRPCQGCGSTLGGAREALTVWFAPEPVTP